MRCYSIIEASDYELERAVRGLPLAVYVNVRHKTSVGVSMRLSLKRTMQIFTYGALKAYLLVLFMLVLLLITARVGSRSLWITDGGLTQPRKASREFPAEAMFIEKWNVTNLQNQYHVITMLSLYCGHVWPGYESFSREQLDERDREYLLVLESNLNHPLVQEVHLLYTDDDAFKVIKRQKWKNMGKITPVKTERRLHMMDFFHYAEKYLMDIPVIALNGDIMIGEGFDLVDTARLRDERTLYSLSRHGYTSPTCSTDNYCLDVKYKGSHDTHVFRLAEELDEAFLLKLDYPINSWQAENGMIGAFKNYFRFHVYNPCTVLKTYHVHCSPVHKRSATASILKPPYNWSYNQLGKAKPEDSLVYGP